MLFFLSFSAHSQTITGVYPTRVTDGVTVTIEGSDFTDTTRNSISFIGGGMDVQNKKIAPDGTRMFFDIGKSTTTLNSNPFNSASEDISRQLQLSINGTLTPVEIANEALLVTYIAPTAMIHAVAPYTENSRIRVNNRIEEIYTDYGGIKTYADGDEFTRGASFNSTTFGRWEFFNLEFPATPSGVLVETGGRGRGMFIGFNSSGEFVARGGDGRSLRPDGCARLVLPASTFANNSGGRILVTLDPRNGSGELTFQWDEDNDGTPEISTSVIAGANYLGYDTFREWSGGNRGFVGKSNGNIAGSEISGTADFNGTIGSMTFSNFEEAPIAWRSSWGTYSNQPVSETPDNPIIPDNYHDLLGFKYDGVVYATGANNELLEMFLGNEIVDDFGNPVPNRYDQTTFKAYSTNGVQNTTVAQHHIFTGEFVDGKELEGPTEFRNNIDPDDPNYEAAFAEIRGLKMFDVLIDGENGLNIGSGINNLNQSTSIQFFSGNGEFGGASDDVPDLLIPNMAEAGGTDVYYYTDTLGNVIGRPISIRINNSDINNPPLSHWQNDQYRVTYPGVSFDLAEPIERIYGSAQQRPMRLIAFKLQDFGISEGDDSFSGLERIENINAGAGGTADIPFLAYNGDTFQIRSPEVISRPTPRSICEVPSNIDVTFEVTAGVDGGFTGDPNEELTFNWFRFNTNLNQEQTGGTTSSIIINNVGLSDLGLYRVRISNSYGTTIVTVPIEEGGTPAIWDGRVWNFPSGFIAQGEPNPGNLLTEVADEDRRLIWQEGFAIMNADVVGCDCVIAAGSLVTISNEKTLKLFGDIVLNPEEPELDDMGTPTGNMKPAGQLNIYDGASLVQTKDIDVNKNEGDIVMERLASDINLYDYIYWSSPVAEFDIENLSTTPKYYWNTNTMNSNGTEGNWIAATGAMEKGRGYIVRVPSSENFTSTFTGKPNNGRQLLTVHKTINGNQNVADKHWNLIGNPYPSAISAQDFLNAPENDKLEGAVYIWSRANAISDAAADPYYDDFSYNYPDSYITFNSTGSNPPNFNGNIAAGQSFFVKVDDASSAGDILFSNTMRFDNSGDVYDNSEFFSPQILSRNDEKQLIWLSMVDASNNSATTLVGFVNGATEGRDRLYDAYMNSFNELRLYSLLEESKMSIQGFPLPLEAEDKVSLGVVTPISGSYQIAIEKLQGSIVLHENTDIYLEDTLLEVFHDLKQSPYSFTIEDGVLDNRFVLRFNANELLSTDQATLNDTNAYIINNELHVNSQSNIREIIIYDVSGKEVVHFKLSENQMNFSANFQFSKGVYFAAISLENNQIINKKLLN